jgi:hypothetical protein
MRFHESSLSWRLTVMTEKSLSVWCEPDQNAHGYPNGMSTVRLHLVMTYHRDTDITVVRKLVAFCRQFDEHQLDH